MQPAEMSHEVSSILFSVCLLKLVQALRPPRAERLLLTLRDLEEMLSHMLS